MSIVKWEKDETVAIITMNNGENRHDLAFAKKMNTVLDEIISDASISAIIITSSDPKFWCLGLHVDWVQHQFKQKNLKNIKALFYGMDDVFKKLLLAPVPVIAAINGHAFGNGAILACACDFRFMKAGRGYFCFPEVDVNIPFLPGMIAFIRKAIPPHRFNHLALTGKRATAEELEQDQIILKACADEDDLMTSSLAFAKSFSKKRGIFKELKKRFHKQVIEIMDQENPPLFENLSLMVK